MRTYKGMARASVTVSLLHPDVLRALRLRLASLLREAADDEVSTYVRDRLGVVAEAFEADLQPIGEDGDEQPP